MRVGVLGGGRAGVFAGVEAALRGAKVLLFDASAEPIPQTDWLGLLDDPESKGDCEQDRLPSAGVETHLGEPVLSVAPNLSVVTAKGRANFDSIVVATGSSPRTRRLPGSGKQGVFALESAEDYRRLGRELSSVVSVVVCGSGLSAFRVADKLSAAGKRVTLLSDNGETLRRLAWEARQILERAAIERGVRVVDARPERAIGLGSVEAVIALGRVYPCDSLISVPVRHPFVPSIPAEISPNGGVVVDLNLQSSSTGLFAAGDCAEHRFADSIRGVMLAASAEATGRIAGANASGGRMAFEPTQSFSIVLFGVRIAGAGLSLEEAGREGFTPEVVSKKWGHADGCSIVFDSRTERVLGLRLVVSRDGKGTDAVPIVVSQRLPLGDLAYQEKDASTDISLISETAREGLKERT